MVVREFIEINASPDEVYGFLANLNLNGLKVSRKFASIRTIVISSGLSLFSWGENIEISVQSSQSGSLVILKGQGKIQFNITSNPKALSQRIKDVLRGRFG